MLERRSEQLLSPSTPSRYRLFSSWTEQDVGWLSSLFGTAVGAGILYLPVAASQVNIWALLFVVLLAVPAIFLAHRGLTRFCLLADSADGDITTVATQKLGPKFGWFVVIAYFLSIYPITLMYAVSLTNVVEVLSEQWFSFESTNRFIVCCLLLSVLWFLITCGERWVLRAVEALVLPLVFILLGASLSLIPSWNYSKFSHFPSFSEGVWALFIIAPLFIFSLNHSPVCSAFAQSYRLRYQNKAESLHRTEKILLLNTILLSLVIAFFMFSCVLSMTEEESMIAEARNLPVLAVLALRENGSDLFALLSPIAVLLALASSFFGVYMGAMEGIKGIIKHVKHMDLPQKSHSELQSTNQSAKVTKRINLFGQITIFSTCLIVAYFNLSVINLIEIVVAPVLGLILFVLPVYGVYKIKALHRFCHPLSDVLVVLVGIFVIAGFLVSYFM